MDCRRLAKRKKNNPHTHPFSIPQVITEEKSRRTAEYAFAHCRVNNRPKVHVIHKANIMKLTDGE